MKLLITLLAILLVLACQPKDPTGKASNSVYFKDSVANVCYGVVNTGTNHYSNVAYPVSCDTLVKKGLLK
jgi:hypothetical protein